MVDGITQDIPYDHKALAVITYVGIGLAKRSSLSTEPWLQPRFYACTVQTAGGGKSAAEAEVHRQMLGFDEHETPVMPDVRRELSFDSGPALVQALDEHRRLILAPDELAEQFEKARAGATGRNSLFGELLRLYESNETANHTKKRSGEGGRVEIHDALFALIGGATTERFERMFAGSGAGSGLQSRFVLSFSDKTMPRIKTPNDEQVLSQARAALRAVIAAPPRRYRLTAEAQDEIMNWRPFDDDGAEKMKRVLDHAKRFALVVAACQNAEDVTGDIMRLALQFADYQIALRERLFPSDAASHVQAFENRIIKFYEKHGRATEPLVHSGIRTEKLLGGFAAFIRAWEALIRAGKLRPVGITRKKQRVFELA